MVVVYPVTHRRRAGRFWLIVLAAVAAIAITLRLGFWQLSRASEKQALQSVIDHRVRLPALDNQSLIGALAGRDLTHRQVGLQGRWLDQHTVYLENRQMAGKPGFFVLTPLQPEGLQQVIMVQRGWVQRNFSDRLALPALPTTGGLVQVEGRIAPPPAKLYEFESVSMGNIRQNLDLSAYAQETGLALAPFSVLQTGPAGDGLARDWTPITAGVDKHHGYAFQWFALSGLIAIVFVWFQIVRRFIIRR